MDLSDISTGCIRREKYMFLSVCVVKKNLIPISIILQSSKYREILVILYV